MAGGEPVVSAWEPIRGVKPVDGDRVRIGDGPHEGTWEDYVLHRKYRGGVTLDNRLIVDVPLGCSVTVLREVRAERDHYVSTACFHAEHNMCRRVCKFCSRPCGCVCHLVPATPATDR